MSEPLIVARKDGRAGRITLNRPRALHALNEEMCAVMSKALREWRDDAQVDLVLVDHAPGTRGFCAGGDLRMLGDSGASDGADACAFFTTEYRLNALIHNFPKPYIAIIDGVTMGGGAGISVNGSHRVATENTLFAMPESSIGLFADVGGGWFLPRLKGALGNWLSLTGARLKGKDVLAAGLATHYAEAASIDALKAHIVKEGVSALAGLAASAEGGFAPHLKVMDECFAKSTAEEVFAALDASSDPWAAKQRADLATKSPTTLKVTLRQLREGGKAATFEDVMRMEYRIVTRLVRAADFQEGVRAVIIDKDNAPKWNPADLAGVSNETLDRIFAPLGEKELTFN